MSLHINSGQGLGARMAAVPAPDGAAGPQVPSTAAQTEAVTVTVGGGIPSTPPAEVLDAMGVAAEAHERLRATNRRLSFEIDERTGKVIVSVHNTAGRVLFTVPASRALDIASGESLDHLT